MTHDLRLLAAFYRYPELFQAFRNTNANFWSGRDTVRIDAHSLAKQNLMEAIVGRRSAYSKGDNEYYRMWNAITTLETAWDGIDRPAIEDREL